MADKMYEVISEKYTGKHRIYLKGNHIPESEIFGSKEVALNGQKGVKRKNKALPDVKAKLKLVTGKAKAEQKEDKK